MTGFEPFLAAATTGLTSLITEIIKGQGSKAITQLLSQDIGKNIQQVVFSISNQYVQNYIKRYGSLKVLGMREPIPLDSIYINVQFVNEQRSRNFASILELEKNFRTTQKRGFYNQNKDKKDAFIIANECKYLMVLGAPGIGKSTFIRKMGLELIKGKSGKISYQAIPVILELKRIDDENINLTEIIANEFETCGLPNAKAFTEQALKKGKLLILLDGLDEVPSSNLNKVIEAVQDFVDRYDNNRYIASCRLAAYRSNFRRFTDVVIAEFDDEEIKQFIINWFQSEEDQKLATAQKCWETLNKPENTSAKELAHTPLLLTFLCLVYDRSQNFPNNRSTLYRKALRILMEEWASEKRILREEIYQGLNTELEEVLLSEIAYKSFESDKLFLTKAEIVTQIKTFLTSNLNAPVHLSGEAILDAIAIQQGILVERAEDIYSFSHLTLQEYLTAKYIDDHRQVTSLVEQHLTDRRWREVFLLVSGLMIAGNGADELLLAIEDITFQYASNPKINKFLLFINKLSTEIKLDIKELIKRTFIIFILVNINIDKDYIELEFDNEEIFCCVIRINGKEQFYIIKQGSLTITCTLSENQILNFISTSTIYFKSFSNHIHFNYLSNHGGSYYFCSINKLFKTENNFYGIRKSNNIIIAMFEEYIIISNEKNKNIKIVGNNEDKKISIIDDEHSSTIWIKTPGSEDIKKIEDNQIFKNREYKLDIEKINFITQKVEEFKLYIYATNLLIQCKKSAIRVTPQVWNNIEDKLFTPMIK